MKRTWSSLAPILRSDVQGRIFAAVMMDPDAEHSLADLARQADTSHTTALREVERAETTGIVTSRRSGQNRLVRANPTHPLYAPLAQIVLASFGPPAVIVDVLADVEGIDEAYLFGSWAARYLGTPGRWPNDIDVLVVGQPDRDQLYDAAERAGAILGLPVQMTVRSPAQWDTKGKGEDSFVAELRSRPLLRIIGAGEDEDEGEGA